MYAQYILDLRPEVRPIHQPLFLMHLTSLELSFDRFGWVLTDMLRLGEDYQGVAMKTKKEVIWSDLILQLVYGLHRVRLHS